MSVKIAEFKTDFHGFGTVTPVVYKAWQDGAASYRVTARNLVTGNISENSFGSFDGLNETWEMIKKQGHKVVIEVPAVRS